MPPDQVGGDRALQLADRQSAVVGGAQPRVDGAGEVVPRHQHGPLRGGAAGGTARRGTAGVPRATDGPRTGADRVGGGEEPVRGGADEGDLVRRAAQQPARRPGRRRGVRVEAFERVPAVPVEPVGLAEQHPADRFRHRPEAGEVQVAERLGELLQVLGHDLSLVGRRGDLNVQIPHKQTEPINVQRAGASKRPRSIPRQDPARHRPPVETLSLPAADLPSHQPLRNAI